MIYNIDVSFEPFIFFGGRGDWVIFLEMHMYIGPLLETNQFSWGRITWQKYNTHHLFWYSDRSPELSQDSHKLNKRKH